MKDKYNIFIGILIFLILMMMIIFTYFLVGIIKEGIEEGKDDIEDEPGNNSEYMETGQNMDEVPSQELDEFDKSLKKCLEKDQLDSSCRTMVSDPDIESSCFNMGELQDKCFYLAAEMNQNPGYCQNIENNSKREDCLVENEEVFEGEIEGEIEDDI